jgi:hypothetical protein
MRRLRAHPGKTALAALGVLLALVLADGLLATPLRVWAERKVNSSLKGYTVRIGRVRPHLWRLGFDLDNLVVTQDSHPDPPVADFGALDFSLAWPDLLRFKLVGRLAIEHPSLHINLAQLLDEAHSRLSLRQRGWQRAVEALYPLKLDRVKVENGSLLYLSDATASKPIQLTGIFLEAENVRNSAAAPGTFPSPVTLRGTLFGTGQVQFKGAANFLLEPNLAAEGEIRLARVPLDRLSPLAQEVQLKAMGGFLSLDGAVSFTPEANQAHLTQVLVEELRLDYVTSAATRVQEAANARTAVKLARQVRNAPQLLFQVDALKLVNSQIGFVNEKTRPGYRLFLSKASLELDHLSNQAQKDPSTFHGRGAFMGSGTAEVSGSFQPAAKRLDFGVQLRLEDARLPDLNDFLRAHAGVDVADGLFSVFTEVQVRDGQLNGYVKPMFKNLKFYDAGKDRAKPFGKRVELHLLQFLATVFKSRKTQEVATVTTLSGSIDDPKAGEWEAIRKLIGNGLSRAILPGFLTPPARPAPKPRGLRP